jgi:hypothetical protein
MSIVMPQVLSKMKMHMCKAWRETSEELEYRWPLQKSSEVVCTTMCGELSMCWAMTLNAFVNVPAAESGLVISCCAVLDSGSKHIHHSSMHTLFPAEAEREMAANVLMQNRHNIGPYRAQLAARKHKKPTQGDNNINAQ